MSKGSKIGRTKIVKYLSGYSDQGSAHGCMDNLTITDR